MSLSPHVPSSSTFTNTGILAPGLSPGIITMNGAQPLSESSTLQIEIQDGSGAGTGHDQLTRSGNLTLAFGFEEDFKTNFMRQDAGILNLQRACEQVIDLSNHLIKIQGLTVPKSSRDSFKVLTEAGVLTDALGQNLERMVGFRNVAVPEYQKINLDIVTSIVQHHLTDLRKFVSITARMI